MTESKAKIAELEAKTANLTDKREIAMNKRDIKMENANYNTAKGRSDELLARYNEMMDEKKTRDEEQAFQDMIDAEYAKTEQAQNAINMMWDNYHKMEEEMWNIPEDDNKSRDQMGKNMEYLMGEINKLDEQLQPIYDKINNLYTDKQRKEDEGRAKQ